MNRTAIAVLAFVLVAAVLWAVVISQSGDPEQGQEVAAAPEQPPTPAAKPAAKPVPPNPPDPESAPQAPAPAQAPSPVAKAPTAPTAPSDPTPTSENRVPVPTNVGNLAELKARFESEPRDSAASEEETKIQNTFRAPNMPAGLLGSALCRETVCRVEFRWTEARAEGYMGGMMALSSEFKMDDMAVDEGVPDAQGGRTIFVYFERKR